MPLRKSIDDYELRDDIMFSIVMRNAAVVKLLLKYILGREVTSVSYHNTQESMTPGLPAKGVRLDVYLEGDGEVYNVEMQLDHKKATGKRARYYSSIIDRDHLKRGEDYTKLPEVYVIFFTTEDPLRENRALQEFSMRSVESNKELDFGVHYMFFNMMYQDANVTEDMRVFLDYLRDPRTVAANTTDTLVQLAENEVEAVRNDESLRGEIMLLEEKLRDQREEGRAEGRVQGRAEGRTAEAEVWNTILALAASGKSLGEIQAVTGRTIEADSPLRLVLQKLGLNMSASPVEEVLITEDGGSDDTTAGTGGETNLRHMQLS